MSKTKIQWKPLIISILISLGVGSLSALFTMNSMTKYKSYNLPVIAPPSYIFPIMWTILFILMGISAYRIFISKSDKKLKANAFFLYGLQLLINFFWSIIFFKLELIFFAFLWILLLWIVVLIMILRFYKVNRKAAYLQIPYLLWITFASYLNLGIYMFNK